MSTEHEAQENAGQGVSESVVLGLAGVGGLGITVMMLAAGVGVVDPTADSNLIGLLVLAGLFLLSGSIVAWFMVVQPHKHFDDINQPLVEEHSDH